MTGHEYRHMRKNTGMTQRQVAGALGVSERKIRMIEAGETVPVNDEYAMRWLAMRTWGEARANA